MKAQILIKIDFEFDNLTDEFRQEVEASMKRIADYMIEELGPPAKLRRADISCGWPAG